MTGTDPPDSSTAAYTDRERAIVTALTRLRPAGLDADSAARAKDRLMLRLIAEPVDAPAPTTGSAIAS
ncbi:hypothetical protein ACQEVB_26590 [Pseudonocardia sp. CA-107938]|uniref:hypothetical protein n=1 Tax=Pseudonocardia sp. CA-107938 TaxID=3240021 RepID=UPI003D8F93AD